MSVRKWRLAITKLIKMATVEVSVALMRLCQASDQSNPKLPPKLVALCLCCNISNIAKVPPLTCWLRKAAEKGVAEAQFLLADKVDKDGKEKIKWLS